MSPIRQFGVADVQALQDAAEQATKDASDAIKTGFKGFGSKIREQLDAEKARRMENARKMSSQHDLNTLWTAIREFVWAETRLVHAEITQGKDSAEAEKQREQSSRMETSVREQLEILNERVIDGQSGGSPHHRMS